MSISKLKNICEMLNENEPEINKNFWAVSMHGDELDTEFAIPDGVRIIMFCYSGRALHVCPKFDNFIWEEILLNENASYNYCTFLANIAQYPSIRDHFCIYEKNTRIKDILLYNDSDFRSGIYKIPVYGSVFSDNILYLSSDKIFSESIEKFHLNIRVNKKKTAGIIKKKNADSHIFSKHIMDNQIKLSELVKKISTGLHKKNNFTIILFTCRSGKVAQYIPKQPTVEEEIKNLYLR